MERPKVEPGAMQRQVQSVARPLPMPAAVTLPMVASMEAAGLVAVGALVQQAQTERPTWAALRVPPLRASDSQTN